MKNFLLSGISNAARSMVVVLLYRIFTNIWGIFLRMASIAKAKALFPCAENLSLDLRTEIKYPQNISIGKNVIIGADCVIGALAPISIGDLVRISRGVIIESATLDFATALPYKHVASEIRIGKGVWLGSQVTILGGVTIGDYAVIGSGTVVAKDVPPRAIVVGAPNRHIRDI